MSLANSTSRNRYVGNGATGTYSYTFRVFSESDLRVTVRNTSGNETPLTLTTDYTVTGVGESAGGTVVLVSSGQSYLTGGNLTTGYVITIRRIRPLTQTTDIRNQGDFYPEIHEDTFDHVVMLAQQHDDDITRSLSLPETFDSSDFNPVLPATLPANAVIAINASGNGFDLSTTVTDLSNAVTAAANAATSATDAAASASAAAASQSSAGSSATAASSSATAAAASATAASSSATAAATNESNAASSASAASTSATNAAASASAAASSAAALNRNIRTVTANTTVDPATDYDIVVNATSASVTVTAPAALGNSKYCFRVKRIDASAHTVAVSSADLIDGAASFSILSGDAFEFKTDGSTFYVF